MSQKNKQAPKIEQVVEEKLSTKPLPKKPERGCFSRYFLILVESIMTWLFIFTCFALSFWAIHYMVHQYHFHLIDVIKNFVLKVPAFNYAQFSTPEISIQITSIPLFAVFCSLFLVWASRCPVIQLGIFYGGLKNDDPRSQQAAYPAGSLIARATNAHYNAIEAFPAFAVAIIIGLVTKMDSSVLDKASIMYVLSRVIFHILYLINLHIFRSLSWIFGFSLTVYLLFLSAVKIQ
jgi:uncharacterized MAPEG superfamily protein